MGVHLGLNCKLYVDDAGGYVSPGWTEARGVKDVTLNLEKTDTDVTPRGNNGWNVVWGKNKVASIDFGILWDPSDAEFSMLLTAFLTDIDINVAIMDGNIATTGSQGLRAMMLVSKFHRNEPINEAVFADVSIKPVYFPDKPPEWLTI